jgi:hypothetical protein
MGQPPLSVGTRQPPAMAATTSMGVRGGECICARREQATVGQRGGCAHSVVPREGCARRCLRAHLHDAQPTPCRLPVPASPRLCAQSVLDQARGRKAEQAAKQGNSRSMPPCAPASGRRVRFALHLPRCATEAVGVAHSTLQHTVCTMAAHRPCRAAMDASAGEEDASAMWARGCVPARRREIPLAQKNGKECDCRAGLRPAAIVWVARAPTRCHWRPKPLRALDRLWRLRWAGCGPDGGWPWLLGPSCWRHRP